MDLRNRDHRPRAVLFRIVREIPANTGQTFLSAAITTIRISTGGVIKKTESKVRSDDQPDHHQQPGNALSCCSSDIPAHREPPARSFTRAIDSFLPANRKLTPRHRDRRTRPNRAHPFVTPGKNASCRPGETAQSAVELRRLRRRTGADVGFEQPRQLLVLAQRPSPIPPVRHSSASSSRSARTATTRPRPRSGSATSTRSTGRTSPCSARSACSRRSARTVRPVGHPALVAGGAQGHHGQPQPVLPRRQDHRRRVRGPHHHRQRPLGHAARHTTTPSICRVWTEAAGNGTVIRLSATRRS